MGRRILNRKELRADFEYVWGRIYGSQIAALRVLRAMSPAGVERDGLEANLRAVKAQFPALQWVQNLPFERWFAFLEQNDLATRAADAADLFHVTPKGTGFLTYIEALAYPNRLF